jgi:hypothetical protein
MHETEYKVQMGQTESVYPVGNPLSIDRSDGIHHVDMLIGFSDEQCHRFWPEAERSDAWQVMKSGAIFTARPLKAAEPKQQAKQSNRQSLIRQNKRTTKTQTRFLVSNNHRI